MAAVRGTLRRFDVGYLLVLGVLWIAVGLGLVEQLELSWPIALAVSAAACTLHGFVCRSAKHVARSTPLFPRASTGSALLTLAGASLFAGALFAAVCGVLLAVALSEPTRIREIAVWLLATGSGSYLLSLAYFYATAARADAVVARRAALEAELSAKDAELAALSAKLSPHFLFNALSSIAALTTLDPKGARAMVLELAEFLRSRLHAGDAELVPLAEELRIARQYLAIEKLRFGDRLTVDEKIDEAALAVKVPSLLLQPLLENALRHGIATLEDGGTITLEAVRQEGGLRLLVDNPTESARLRPSPRGMGLGLVSRRLAVHYGSRASLSVEPRDGQFAVRLFVPFNEETMP